MGEGTVQPKWESAVSCLSIRPHPFLCGNVMPILLIHFTGTLWGLGKQYFGFQRTDTIAIKKTILFSGGQAGSGGYLILDHHCLWRPAKLNTSNSDLILSLRPLLCSAISLYQICSHRLTCVVAPFLPQSSHQNEQRQDPNEEGPETRLLAHKLSNKLIKIFLIQTYLTYNV